MSKLVEKETKKLLVHLTPVQIELVLAKWKEVNANPDEDIMTVYLLCRKYDTLNAVDKLMRGQKP